MGVTAINGLPILIGNPNLLSWYQANLVGGQNSFAIAAGDFTKFGTAIEQKLAREIEPISTDIPEPNTVLATLALGAYLTLGRIKRFQQQKSNNPY